MKSSKTILIVAGEASGDLYGAELLLKLKNKFHNLNFVGMGGENMAKLKPHQFISYKTVSVTGGTEVFKRIHHIFRAFQFIKSLMRSVPIDAAVLIDFPDFNFLLLKHLKRKKIPIIYYVSPQLWAWRKGRIKKIKKYVREMLVIFPFEARWYEQRGAYATYVGHPLVRLTQSVTYNRTFPKNRIRIGIFPGSRENEIKRLLPPMIETASEISKVVAAEFYLFKLSHIDEVYYAPVTQTNLPIKVIVKESISQLKDIDFALACSGTLTVELALLKIPMVILYKLSPISYYLGKLLMSDIKNIGMVNLILGESCFPEFVQHEVKPHHVASHVLEYLRSESKYNEALKKLDSFRAKLSPTTHVIPVEEVVEKYV